MMNGFVLFDSPLEIGFHQNDQKIFRRLIYVQLQIL